MNLDKFLRTCAFGLAAVWLLWLWESHAKADELYLLEPTYLSMESWKVEHKVDDFYPYSQQTTNDGREYWSYGAAIRMNANLIRWGRYSLYTRNRIDMNATNRQVRSASWFWDQGLNFNDKLEIFYHHHSQHILDDVGNGAYPLEDYVGVRMIFLSTNK